MCVLHSQQLRGPPRSLHRPLLVSLPLTYLQIMGRKKIIIDPIKDPRLRAVRFRCVFPPLLTRVGHIQEAPQRTHQEGVRAFHPLQL
jgi:hypothetical protein